MNHTCSFFTVVKPIIYKVINLYMVKFEEILNPWFDSCSDVYIKILENSATFLWKHSLALSILIISGYIYFRFTVGWSYNNNWHHGSTDHDTYDSISPDCRENHLINSMQKRICAVMSANAQTRYWY